MVDTSKFLSIPEAAAMLGVSRIAVFKQVKKGRLSAIRIGRNWAVPAGALTKPRSGDAAPLKAAGTESARATRVSAGPGKERRTPPPEAPEKTAPPDNFMDDLGWD